MFNRRFAPMLGAAGLMLGLGAAILDIGAAAQAAIPDHPTDMFIGRSSKGHGWGGKRRRLKKWKQDHQRPRRRRK